MWSPLRTASSRLRFLLWRRIHTAQLAVLSQIYRGTPFLVKRQTTTCSRFISLVLAVPLGLLVKGRHSGEEWRQVSIQNIPHPFPVVATCSHPFPPPRPQSHAPWADCRGMRVDCYCRRGQRRKGGGYSVLLDGPQVPDVTLFNDIIMTVSRLPLALSLEVMHTAQAHTHKRT